MSAYRIADRYAKSLLGLAKEQNKVEEVHNDVLYFNEVCDVRDFEMMLKSPIIHGDKKEDIIQTIIGSKVNDLTMAFIKLLINKGREGYLPEIGKAFVRHYNKLKNITPVTIKTAVPITEDTLNAIRAKVKDEENLEQIELSSAVDERLIGGFTLQFNDLMYDASVARKLKEISKQVLDSSYEYRIHG
jgi:F-type H+-transporting ATPase subunit delta